MYRKIPKNSDTRKICCNHPKISTRWHYHRVICPKDADRMANRVDPDQTARLGGVDHCGCRIKLGAVWSGSTLFAKPFLSKNLLIITVNDVLAGVSWHRSKDRYKDCLNWKLLFGKTFSLNTSEEIWFMDQFHRKAVSHMQVLFKT